MAGQAGGWRTTRVPGLELRHRPEVDAQLLLRALELHRGHAARGREACEHWGPGSSVSRVRLVRDGERCDWAVKWNHPRGRRRAWAEALRGSRARRAAAGAERLRRVGLRPPKTLAVVERRGWLGVAESFLVMEFVDGAEPLPALAPELRRDRVRRRALARSLGDALGRLHAAGLDHRDLKHSNLLLDAGGELTWLDLEALEAPARLALRRRVRALGQLEAYARDLYPWLPRTDRLRFLEAYLRHAPELAPRRRELSASVGRWVETRIAEWARKDRRGHHRFPLGPREPRTREGRG